MFKKLLILLFVVLLLVNMYGCIALLAGTAVGAGTAVWLSGKLSQEVNVPFERTINAAKSALKSLKLEVTKVTVEQNTAQIMSKYSDGKTVWIDIHRITEASSKIEVRVGAVSTDKEAADIILKRIMRYI
jgi:hypothetical protein